jgi:ectoine hydroxylase-related dioxygenase (phytanoyl-CoA dioxygenase family)
MESLASDPRLDEFERTGAVLIQSALEPELVRRLLDAAARTGARRPGQSTHLLEFLGRDPVFLDLVDHPATLPLVVAALGWNIHLYHSHLDVHPPAPSGPRPWRWHQDGGRQNLEIESAPRPRLSVKVAYFLSDCSRPTRGNMLIIPGSHRRDTLRRPSRLDDVRRQPAGAEPVIARPGDALVFDRRLWHARSDNRSRVPRIAMFCAYTYRWIQPRGLYPELLAGGGLTPVRRQLLGAASSQLGYWQPREEDVPLRTLT